MSNVVNFQDRAPRFSESRAQRPTGAANADISELVSRVTGLQTKVIGQIDNAILMLDLAAQHARQIAKRVRDPAAKDQFDQNISTIEQLLQFAREKAMKL